MPGNKYKDISSPVPNTRTARLLRERELRRSSRGVSTVESNDGNNRPILENDANENDNSYVEQYLEGAAQAELNEGWERPPPRQRLLVVANRLPVSAVRRGEDSWSLEISAGGLVSALLGEFLSFLLFLLHFFGELFCLMCVIIVGVEFEAQWIGWAGVNVPDKIGQQALTKALAEKVR